MSHLPSALHALCEDDDDDEEEEDGEDECGGVSETAGGQRH